MQYALTKQGRDEATPHARGFCPLCNGVVIAKCGQINVHHWAHATTADCDPWGEPESEWHRGWKRHLPAEQTEVVRAGHRADIVLASDIVVELQHSSISVDKIQEREQAYGRMVWLFDGTDLEIEWTGTEPGKRKPPRLDLGLIPDRNGRRPFRWSNPPRHYSKCQCPVYVDLGPKRWLLQVFRWDFSSSPCRGLGKLIEPDHFINWLKGGGVP